MALIRCPECGREISDRAASCPSCGYSMPQEPKPTAENIASPNDAAVHHNPAGEVVNKPVHEEIGLFNHPSEQPTPPPKRKKLKGWQKALIGIASFVFVLAVLFVVFILIPAIKSTNSYKEISPYLNYVGTPHPNADEAITLTEEEYNNIENVEILKKRGEISFKTRDGYISSCTWTSFDFYSEEEYRAFAEDLYILFNAEPDTEAESYGNGNTYRYSWTDPYYGFTVTMAHGLYAYDPDGEIEIKWEVSDESCSILGHIWLDATCIAPKTCRVCEATEGDALGHQGGEWSEWDLDYNDAVNARELTCTECGEAIETEEEPITSFINSGRFTIYPNAFADRFEASSSRLSGIDYNTKSEYAYDMPTFDEENYVYYRIQDKNHDYTDIGIMSFTDPRGKTVSVINNFSENSFNCINILIEDSRDVSAVVYSTVLAIDPGIDYSEAADVGQKIVDSIAIAVGDINAEDFQGINYQGINYLAYRDREYHYLVVSVASE